MTNWTDPGMRELADKLANGLGLQVADVANVCEDAGFYGAMEHLEMAYNCILDAAAAIENTETDADS